MAEKRLIFLDPFAFDPKKQIFSLRVQQDWDLSDLHRALKAEHFPFKDRSPNEINVLILSQYLDYPHTPEPSRLVTDSANPTYNGIALAEFSPVEKILKRFPTVTEDNEQIQMIVYVDGNLSSHSAPADLGTPSTGDATLYELRRFHQYVGQNPMPSKALEIPPEILNTMEVDNATAENEIPLLSDSMDGSEISTNAEEISTPFSQWAENPPSSVWRSSQGGSHLHRSSRDRERSPSPCRRSERLERDYRDKERDYSVMTKRDRGETHRRSETPERRKSASPERRRDDKATPPPVDDQNPDPMRASGGTGVLDATGDLLPDPTFLQSPLVSTKLLVRPDYIRIYNFIDGIYNNRGRRSMIVIITGQPGIGKTMWLDYAMYRRIQLGLPFIYYQAGKYYRFTKEGVEEVGTGDFGAKLSEPHWCFIDACESPNGVPDSMSGLKRFGVFPIYVTSPRISRWKMLDKVKKVHRVVMNPWTLEEMEVARCEAYPDLDPAEMKKRFRELGPTARVCLEYNDDEIKDFRQSRKDGIKKLDLETLEAMIDTPTDSPQQNSSDLLSHKIILIRRPDNNPSLRDMIVEFMSENVLRELVVAYRKRDDDQLAALWRYMSYLDKCGIPTGRVFELTCFKTDSPANGTTSHPPSPASGHKQCRHS